MPLIIITGIPCSGKTKRCNELKEYFQNKAGKNVDVINEIDVVIKSGYDKNTFYADSKKEKSVRSDIKSATQRMLNVNDVLIIDGSNYIKGYRYEIYCMTKLYKTPQCTVHCDIPVEHAWLWNERRPECEQYNREIFDALVMRYETPNSKDRWDSPLFTISAEDELKFDEIYGSLYKVKAPKPNLSTQCPPLASTNYLYELNSVTQEVVNAILSAKKLGIENEIKILDYNLTVQNSCTEGQLMRLRRQFLTYSKMQQIEVNQIAALFVQYLNKSL
ncbi:protein KTI12 homolog isoform X1 [Colletes gigas]|uniref:protein KTI12 homolog isoform X1 n=1 Tax=Colletes gigas TaxID=935657 RepID=UPI001C9BA6A3|nr:protein KTI12 homolog isoform X1 [Colletes gigas]